MAIPDKAKEVLSFWLGEGLWTGGPNFVDPETQKKWFMAGGVMDPIIKAKFGDDVVAARSGQYDSWRSTPYGTIAGIILMDQFTRNIYRNTPEMFASDAKALQWAKDLMASGQMSEVLPVCWQCVALPLMHSEALEDQEMLVKVMDAAIESQKQLGFGDAPLVGFFTGVRNYGVKHRDVIAKWGRFPHRNAILGRSNTPEEDQGLKDGSIATF